jgi:hypothetical protein
MGRNATAEDRRILHRVGHSPDIVDTQKLYSKNTVTSLLQALQPSPRLEFETAAPGGWCKAAGLGLRPRLAAKQPRLAVGVKLRG